MYKDFRDTVVTVNTALRAQEIHAAGDYSFELVVGEEITTRRGHVLALFLTERIPALRQLPETLERVHDQGIDLVVGDLTVGALVRGILDRPVRIVQLEWHGHQTLV